MCATTARRATADLWLHRLKSRELLRFAEDQFVCWEMPARADFSSSPLEIEDRNTGVRHWRILPAALEQYGWYVPIDASNAKLLRTYLALYRAEGSPLDLAKARTMADSIVRAQTALGTGSIPTQWIEWDMLPTSERVEIRVSRAELAYWANGRRTEATGEFLAWIAPDSDSGRRLSFTLP